MNDIDKVIDKLNELGWHKGALRNPNGTEVCLVGAHVEAGVRGTDCLIEDAIEQLFPEQVAPPNGLRVVARFNDHPDTTFEDVILVLKHAREAAE